MDLIQRRRVMLSAGKRSRLPREYQEVEYLESTGTQYIDTGIEISVVSSLDTNWSLVFEITQQKSVYIIAGTNTDLKQLPVVYGNFRAGDFAVGSGSFLNPIIAIETSKRYVLQQVRGFLNIDGASYEIRTTSSSHAHFGIFGKLFNNGSTELNTLTSMKLYGFTADSNGTSISTIIPCYRKSDEKPGVYDTVRKLFLTNAGTGEFLVGPDVN